ncbi:hypothetical protein ACWDCO_17310 [Streptomyces albogriseolus]
MKIPLEMLAAKEALAETLERLMPIMPGVIAVDVGLREDDVELTDELVIRVFVSNQENIPAILQPLLADTPFPIAVVERDFEPLGDSGRYRPVVGGISIAAAHGAAAIQQGIGTLGGLARDILFPGSQVGVSCAHVIAESAEPVMQGDPIYQPEPGAPGNQQIGALLRWSETTDIAICSTDVPVDYSIVGIGAYSGMTEATVSDVIRKRGRSTDLTEGKVSGVGLRFLGSGTPANGFEVWSRGGVPPLFCDHGDSGSLLIDDDNSVIGLLMQGGLPLRRFVTWGSGLSGYISGIATQMIPAANSVGITF